jgi:cell shape-determining protein MreD
MFKNVFKNLLLLVLKLSIQNNEKMILFYAICFGLIFQVIFDEKQKLMLTSRLLD